MNPTITPSSKKGFKKKFFHVLAKPLNKVLRRIYDYRLRHTGVDANMIVFQSKPDYSDNAKAYSEYLAANHPEYEIYWILENAFLEIDGVQGRVTFYHRKNKYDLLSFSAYKMMATAQYVFATHGYAIPYSYKRAGQQYIHLGHGCGYKGKSYRDGHRSFDKGLVVGNLFIKTQADYWGAPEDAMMPVGYPRFDWMLHPSQQAHDLLKQVSRQRDTVIIWMPTFRNSTTKISYKENAITAFPLMKDQHDWEHLDACCREKNVLLIVKLHISQRSYDIDFSHLTNIMQMTNADFEQAGVELYHFLPLATALISDYSSVSVDYLLTDKPIAFALDDYQQYQDSRGFAFDNPLDYMPGHHLYQLDDLLTFIGDVTSGNDKYAEERHRIRQIAFKVSAHYCQDLTEALGL